MTEYHITAEDNRQASEFAYRTAHHELATKRSVLYLTARALDARVAFEACRFLLDSQIRIARAGVGDWEIQLAPGSRIMFRTTSMTVRGWSFDTIVAVGADRFPEDWEHEFWPALAASSDPRVYIVNSRTADPSPAEHTLDLLDKVQDLLAQLKIELL